jgi:hypothetical protein
MSATADAVGQHLAHTQEQSQCEQPFVFQAFWESGTAHGPSIILDGTCLCAGKCCCLSPAVKQEAVVTPVEFQKCPEAMPAVLHQSPVAPHASAEQEVQCKVRTKQAHAIGSAVEYFSTSHEKWIPAVVRGFNGRYQLDIKSSASPSKVRAQAAPPGQISQCTADKSRVPAGPEAHEVHQSLVVPPAKQEGQWHLPSVAAGQQAEGNAPVAPALLPSKQLRISPCEVDLVDASYLDTHTLQSQPALLDGRCLCIGRCCCLKPNTLPKHLSGPPSESPDMLQAQETITPSTSASDTEATQQPSIVLEKVQTHKVEVPAPPQDEEKLQATTADVFGYSQTASQMAWMETLAPLLTGVTAIVTNPNVERSNPLAYEATYCRATAPKRGKKRAKRSTRSRNETRDIGMRT